MNRIKLPLEAYQLEEDQKLIEKIMNHELTQKLLDWVRDQKIDEVYNTVYRSSFLKANEQITPMLIRQLKKACEIVGLQEIPDVYLLRDFEDTITIGGVSSPFLL